MFRRTLLAAGALAVAGTAALAATDRNDSADAKGRVTIFSNLGSDDDVYNCCSGYSVVGPQTGPGELWVASAFTPDADRVVTEIDVGASYNGAGKNRVVLTLYSDNAGVPGSKLGSWQVHDLPAWQTCCELTKKRGRVRLNVSVKAGTQYWLGLSNDAKNKGLSAVWNWNSTDTNAANPPVESWCSSDDGGFCFFDKQWTPLSGPQPAFAVYGR